MPQPTREDGEQEARERQEANRKTSTAKAWHMKNLDSGEVLQGQFEAENVVEDVGAEWTSSTALNRQDPIDQFSHGLADNLSFASRFYRLHRDDDGPLQKLAMLKNWVRIDPSLRRPPIVEWWMGDGLVRIQAKIMSIRGIRYGSMDQTGSVRDVIFTVELEKFVQFNIEEEAETDTRYAHAAERDYYELLAAREYGTPTLGDVIRKLHPSRHGLTEGEVVKLPSIEGVRSKVVTQTSMPLSGAYSRKETDQRTLRLEWFEKRSVARTSHYLQPSTAPK